MVGAPRRAPDFMVIYLAGTQPMWKHTPWIARMPGFGKPRHQLGPTQVQCFLLIGFAGFSPFALTPRKSEPTFAEAHCRQAARGRIDGPPLR
jgi:hypothetical protein